MKSVFNSIDARDEVILVNDCSSDRTVEVAQAFNVKSINLEMNSGPSAARNAGARLALNDILVFLDSDMEITKSSIDKIRSYFELHENVQSLTLNFKIDLRESNFSTRYKSHYMSYVTRDNKRPVNYIYGSYCATRKKGFFNWPENLRFTEDSVWGYQQTLLGHEIRCLDGIEARHLKQYSLSTLLKNDFNIAAYFAKNFLSEKRWLTLFGKEKFGHTSKKQMISVLLSGASLLSLAVDFNLFLALMTLWPLINYNFFTYILKNNRVYFWLKTIIFYYITNLVYLMGITFGSLLFLDEKRSDLRIKQTT